MVDSDYRVVLRDVSWITWATWSYWVIRIFWSASYDVEKNNTVLWSPANLNWQRVSLHCKLRLVPSTMLWQCRHNRSPGEGRGKTPSVSLCQFLRLLQRNKLYTEALACLWHFHLWHMIFLFYFCFLRRNGAKMIWVLFMQSLLNKTY